MLCRALKTPAVKYMMVGQEKKAVEEYNCPAFPFLQTMHQNAANIAVLLEHFVLVQEELDFENFQAVRQMPQLKCS